MNHQATVTANVERAAAPALLEVDGLHAGYGMAEVLQGMNFRVLPGEFVVLLARADATGGLDVVACLDSDPALTAKTVRRAAA